MCGLYGGASSTLSDHEVECIRELGIINQVRGLDSTGVAMVYRNKGHFQTSIAKSVANASTVLYSNEISKKLSQVRPHILAGHVRSATLGDITTENAHPFQIGRITGMHNGTIHNLEGKEDDRTDSEAMFKLISSKGLQYAITAAKNGAYALVWIDGGRSTLNFIRNGQRPLFLAQARGVLYWSSEYYALKLVADRHAMGFAEAPKLLDPYIHLEVPLSNPLNNHKRTKVEPQYFTDLSKYGTKVEETKALPKPEIKHTHVVMGPTGEEKPWKDSIPKSGKASSVPQVDPPKTYSYDKTHVKYRAFKGKSMDLGKARALLREGCAFCTKEVHDCQSNAAFWFNHKQYLCSNCKDLEFARTNVNAKKMYPGLLLPTEKCCGNC